MKLLLLLKLLLLYLLMLLIDRLLDLHLLTRIQLLLSDLLERQRHERGLLLWELLYRKRLLHLKLETK